jgi:hypothetical protein
MIVSLNSRHRSHAGALPKDHADGAQHKTKKESRANIARRLSRSRIPKASAPRLHQKNRLRPQKQNPLCPISQSSAHAQRVSLCRFLRSQPRRIGLGYRRTGRDPDPPSFTIARPTSRLPIQTGKAFRAQAGGDPLGTKPGMLWADRVGNRRSQTILTRNFSEKTGTGTKQKRTGKPKELVSHGIRNQESFCFVSN